MHHKCGHRHYNAIHSATIPDGDACRTAHSLPPACHFSPAQSARSRASDINLLGSPAPLREPPWPSIPGHSPHKGIRRALRRNQSRYRFHACLSLRSLLLTSSRCTFTGSPSLSLAIYFTILGSPARAITLAGAMRGRFSTFMRARRIGPILPRVSRIPTNGMRIAVIPGGPIVNTAVRYARSAAMPRLGAIAPAETTAIATEVRIPIASISSIVAINISLLAVRDGREAE